MHGENIKLTKWGVYADQADNLWFEISGPL